MLAHKNAVKIERKTIINERLRSRNAYIDVQFLKPSCPAFEQSQVRLFGKRNKKIPETKVVRIVTATRAHYSAEKTALLGSWISEGIWAGILLPGWSPLP